MAIDSIYQTHGKSLKIRQWEEGVSKWAAKTGISGGVGVGIFSETAHCKDTFDGDHLNQKFLDLFVTFPSFFKSIQWFCICCCCCCFCSKGGTPDYHRAYVHFITRFRKGMLGRVLLDRDQLKEKQQFLPASGHLKQDYL